MVDYAVTTVNTIMDYESGQLDDEGVIKLFSDLIKTGAAWRLQGSYGRQAARMIEAGIIDRHGEINPDWRELAE